MLRDLFVESLRQPRLAARRVLALDLPGPVIVEAAICVTCLGIVLGYLAVLVTPGAIDVVAAAVLAEPLIGAAVQLAAMALGIFLTVRVGRLFGGTGSTRDAAALVVWLNAVMVAIQGAQLVAFLVLPVVGTLLAIAAMVWALWAFASFVAELHGFRNVFVVLGVSTLTAIMLFFGTAMLLAVLGIAPQGVR